MSLVGGPYVLLVTSRLVVRLGLVLMACLPMVSCTDGSDGPRVGSALDGSASNVRFFLTHTRVGGDYGFAFPRLTNRTDKTVTVTDLGVSTIPKGLKLIGYRVFSVREVGDLLESVLGSGGRDDYRSYPNYYSSDLRIEIPAGSVSAFRFAFDIRIERKTPESIEGCIVKYDVDGKSFTQPIDCAFAVVGPGE